MTAADVPPAEEIILYEKDPATRIATITLNRPDQLNIPTIAARRRYADLLVQGQHRRRRQGARRPRRRGPPRHGRRPRRADGEAGGRASALHEEFGIDEDDDVTMPGPRSYRAGASLLHWYGNTRSGCRTPAGLQEDQHPRGQGLLLRLALLPGRRRRPRDLVRRRAVRASRLPLCRLRAAHVAVGDDDGAAQVPGDGVHRPALHGRADVRVQLRQQRRARATTSRRRWTKYASACARTRPTDTVFMQKVFFEVMKQHQGEYMGSLLSAWLESMGGHAARGRRRQAGPRSSKETMDAGLNVAVKDNDEQLPARVAAEPFRSPASRRRLTVTGTRARRRGRARRRAVVHRSSGFRVVDLSTWIGGAYCTKLLADGGAEVDQGRAARGRPAAPVVGLGRGDPGRRRRRALQLPRRLQAERRGRRRRTRAISTSLHALLASADAVVWSPGSPLAEQPALDPAEILRDHPHLVVTSITPFGLDGPWSDKPATEFTLQAWSGGIVGLARGQARPRARVRRRPDRGVARRSLRRHRDAGGPSARRSPAVSSSTCRCSRRWRCASPTTR